MVRFFLLPFPPLSPVLRIADLISFFHLPSGQYFDLDDQLRVNYAHFWLSLISPNSAKVQAERRKYAKLVGNVGADLYPILECESFPACLALAFAFVGALGTHPFFRPTAALTGRIGLGAPNYDELPEEDAKGFRKDYVQQKAGSVMEMQVATPEEESIMRNVSVYLSSSFLFETRPKLNAYAFL